MKKLNLNLSSFLIFFIFILSSIPNSNANNLIVGTANVIDGDTLKINEKKIRLFGIDAPESNQICQKFWLSILFLELKKNYFCGKETTKKLKKLLFNEKVKCEVVGIDRYRRFLAICKKNNLDVNSWLVRNGLAVAYIKYSKKYLNDEKEAKREKKGLWKGNFEMPWNWRKKSR